MLVRLCVDAGLVGVWRVILFGHGDLRAAHPSVNWVKPRSFIRHNFGAAWLGMAYLRPFFASQAQPSAHKPPMNYLG